jgi:hypothetical protein
MNVPNLVGVFPFCIPFDFIAMINTLWTPPQAPVFEIPFEFPGVFEEVIVVDMSHVNSIIPFVHFMILMSVAVSLALGTFKVIRW